MKTMTITIPTNNGEAAYFTIEFKSNDFMEVVETVSNATLENVYDNKLWSVK